MTRLRWLTVGAAFVTLTAHGARPLVTDDTRTVGRRGYQLELGVSHSRDRDGGGLERRADNGVQVAYGARDNLDLSLELPWTHRRIENGPVVSDARGFGDIALSLKWRFWESGAISVALKPKLSLPTGNEAEGLGAGRSGYGSDAIASVAAEPWNFRFQLGFFRNRNAIDERRDIRSASFAVVRDLTERAKLAFDLGVATNTDKTEDDKPAFFIVGFLFALTSGVTADAGYKKGITGPEVDRELVFGLTIAF